ncbi:MAG: co-chaperone GroES [Patescibacteria group bacterium]|nr:co-chaperone GroES [Patescibacteria group bacterium]
MTKFTPKSMHLLVEKAPDIEHKEGGIIVPPSSTMQKPVECVVVAIGHDVVNVSIGDHILLYPQQCAPLLINERQYLLLHVNQYLGKVEEVQVTSDATTASLN